MLDGLIGLVYDAALDDARWAELAPRLATAFGSHSVVLQLRERDRTPPRPISYTPNYDMDVFRHYGRHFAQQDVWVAQAARHPPGTILTSEQLADRATTERTAWFTDWCGPQDVHHLIGVALPLEAAALGIVGIHHSRRSGPFGEDARRLLDALMPHLRRALQMRQRLQAMELQRQAAIEGAARGGAAVVVVAADGRILVATPDAEALLRGPAGLRAVGGRITASDPATAGQLRRLVAQAAETASGRARATGGAMLLHRGEQQAPLSVLVAPFRPVVDDIGASVPAAILFLRRPEAAAVSAPVLRDLYGLTPMEAAVAAALAEGEAVDCIAAGFGVSLNTARSHIKAIMAKTGTNRLPQLVSLMLRSTVLGR